VELRATRGRAGRDQATLHPVATLMRYSYLSAEQPALVRTFAALDPSASATLALGA
jgi:hypothetical protein